MAIERHLIESREQWLGLRKQDVTASVIGALFGAHPYTSALKLYMMHSGIEFDDSDNPAMRRGRLLESAVGLAVGEARPQWTINKCHDYYRDPVLRLGATPDFLIDGDPRGLGVLQTKTAAPIIYERDWDSGKTVPFWIQLQCLVEAMLTGAAFGAVGVLQVHAFDLACAIHEIPRHPGAEQRIVEAVRMFWNDVAESREPEPDYGKDSALLKAIAPREVVGRSVDLSGSNELPALLDQRETIMAAVAAYEDRKAEIETQLKYAMRDAERATGIDGYSITWKTVHRNEYTVPAKDVRTLRINKLKKKD
jgi:predicted phage-related endonuclease